MGMGKEKATLLSIPDIRHVFASYFASDVHIFEQGPFPKVKRENTKRKTKKGEKAVQRAWIQLSTSGPLELNLLSLQIPFWLN